MGFFRFRLSVFREYRRVASAKYSSVGYRVVVTRYLIPPYCFSVAIRFL